MGHGSWVLTQTHSDSPSSQQRFPDGDQTFPAKDIALAPRYLLVPLWPIHTHRSAGTPITNQHMIHLAEFPKDLACFTLLSTSLIRGGAHLRGLDVQRRGLEPTRRGPSDTTWVVRCTDKGHYTPILAARVQDDTSTITVGL